MILPRDPPHFPCIQQALGTCCQYGESQPPGGESRPHLILVWLTHVYESSCCP